MGSQINLLIYEAVFGMLAIPIYLAIGSSLGAPSCPTGLSPTSVGLLSCRLPTFDANFVTGVGFANDNQAAMVYTFLWLLFWNGLLPLLYSAIKFLQDWGGFQL